MILCDDHVIHILCMFIQEEDEDVVSQVAELFPFTKYFSTAPQPVFKGRSLREDMDIAEVIIASMV